MAKDCPHEKKALIAFLETAWPNKLAGDYTQQLADVPVAVLTRMKNAVIKQQQIPQKAVR